MRGHVVSLCVAVGILAGCGSSKAVSTSSPASTAAAATTTAAPTVTAAGAVTTAKVGATPTTAAGAAPKLTGAADNDFCRYIVEQGNKASLSNSDIPVGESPEQLKAATTETQTLFNEMAKRAPAEIKTEMQAVSASFNRLAAIYASVGFDTAKLQQQMSDPASAVAVEFKKIGESDSAGTGGEKVDAYIQDVCGIKG